jgi:hypothetical protein
MIAFDDTREMERRAAACCEDGLFDIGMGLGLLFAGIAMIVGLGALAVIYPALMLPAARSAKRGVTAPRMHHLDFMPEPGGDSRRLRSRAVLLAALAVLLAIGVLALLMSRRMPPHVSHGLRANALVIFGCMLAALFAAVAWMTSARRLRGYAAVALLVFVCGYWFNLRVSWYLMIIGAFVGSYGAVVLSRFVRDYPRFHNRSDRVLQRSI